MDAISLLKQDHEKVSDLFEKFESAKSGKGAIAAEVCRLLTIHATIEEEIFYPAAREALADNEDGADLLDEAEVEHASAKDLIAQIEESDEDEDLFEAKVTVLGEYIEHHVKEEENELFPKVKQTGIDLNALGKELQARKTELLALEDDGEDEEVRPPAGKSKGAKQPRSSKQ